MTAASRGARVLRPLVGRGPLRPADAITHALVIAAVLTSLWMVHFTMQHGNYAEDLRFSFWRAGWLAWHGRSPYHWTASMGFPEMSFVYPSVLAVLLAPMSLIPRDVAGIVAAVAVFGGCLAALRIVGVRDVRAYALTAMWSPVVLGWQTANISLLFVPGLAGVWRLRDRPRAVGILLGVMVAIKPTLWPIALWLPATRRWRAASITVATAIVATGASWLVLGLGQLPVWLRLVHVWTDLMDRQAYGLTALVEQLGGGRTVGQAITAIVTGILAVWCVRLARQGRAREAFTVAVSTVVAGSPVADLHYFALLLVPIGLAHRRASWPYVLPLTLWACPWDNHRAAPIVIAWLVAMVVIGGLVHGERRSTRMRWEGRWKALRDGPARP